MIKEKNIHHVKAFHRIDWTRDWTRFWGNLLLDNGKKNLTSRYNTQNESNVVALQQGFKNTCISNVSDV